MAMQQQTVARLAQHRPRLRLQQHRLPSSLLRSSGRTS